MNFTRQILVSSFLFFVEFVLADVPLSLREALSLSLEKNLALKISGLSVEEKQALTQKAYGAYDIDLNLGVTIDRNITPSSSSLEGVAEDNALKTKDTLTNASLKKKFGFGTTVEVPYKYTIAETNSTNQRFSTAHKPNLTLKITQPFLQSFTPSYFTKNLTLAEYDWEIAKMEHGAKINSTLSKTIQLYFEALKEQSNLQIRKSAYETARTNFEFVKEKRSVGKSSLIDVLEAEGTMQKLHEAYLKAEASLKNKKEEFQSHVFAEPKEGVELDATLLSQMKAYIFKESPEEMLKQALELRMETRKAATSVVRAEAERLGASVDRLPNVDLSGEVTQNGLDENFSKAHQQIKDRTYTSWQASANLKYPLLNYAARGAHAQKELRLEQEKIKQLQTSRDIALEIRKYLRDLDTGWQRISALSKALEAQTQKYEGKQQRFRLGLLSQFELDKALEEKKQAEIELLDAKIAYQTAIYKLAEARGTLLGELELI